MRRVWSKRCRMIWIIQALVLISFLAHLMLNRMHHDSADGRRRFFSFLPKSFVRNSSLASKNASSILTIDNSTLVSDAVREEYFTTPAPRRPFFELFNQADVMASEGCDNDFGFGLTKRWTAAGRTWCSPTIRCHAIQQTAHGGDGDNLCVIENATLDLRHAYNNSEYTREIVIAYRDSSHADQPYIHFKAPVVSTNCTKDSSEWKDNMLPGWNADWMGGGLSFSQRGDCQSQESKPLLIIQRDEFANFYHDSEDFFNAYLALLITGLRPDEVNVLISDLFPWGPYEIFWKTLFPNVRTAWEMKEAAPTCYRKIIIGIFGPASPLTLIVQPTSCERSPLVKGYAQWVWSSFNLNPEIPVRNFTRVLWMSRRSSVVWPEQSYCDNRYFVCGDWTHLGVRTLGRVLSNEDEVVGALQAKRELEVLNKDFNKIPFTEQVQLDVSSDIMIGPHGAGLTHLLFMRDDACVFEVFIDGSENNIHYQNMARWRGLKYTSMVSANPAPAGTIVLAVWDACVVHFLARSPPSDPAPAADGNRSLF